jgi:hypothetical protein
MRGDFNLKAGHERQEDLIVTFAGLLLAICLENATISAL